MHDPHAAPLAQGPLSGLRVVEFAGIGPGPFACMLLSDMGADVVTVARPGGASSAANPVVNRGRTWIEADLKDPADRDAVLTLLHDADVLVEGFRPGVMERLGLGPDVVAARNRRLVYGRMTGWGQHGPLAQSAGHDINYIAITGALHAIGSADSGPLPPLNLVGDYGGGSLYLVAGLLAALWEARRCGHGQTVDAAISDGVISMMGNAVARGMRGAFHEARGTNMLDGGHPYYGAYETADGEHVSIGAIEPQFFAELCTRLGLPAELHGAQHDTARWPDLRAALAQAFKSATQAQWVRRLEGSDACFAPVLPLSAAMRHPHNVARASFVEVDGRLQPAPAPRFSRTPSAVQQGTARGPVDIIDVARRWASAALPG